jgi:hypothetical protein
LKSEKVEPKRPGKMKNLQILSLSQKTLGREFVALQSSGTNPNHSKGLAYQNRDRGLEPTPDDVVDQAKL